MNFNVTYRTVGGKQDVIALCAENREELFKSLAECGITAIRVEEAKVKAARRGARRVKHVTLKARVAVIFWLLLALVAASIFLFCALRTASDVELEETKMQQPSDIVEAMPETAAPETQKTVEPPATPKPAEPAPFVKRPGALQLQNGKVITFKPPAPGEEKTVWVQGRKYTVDSEGNFRDDSPVHTFDNRFENTMEAMSAVGGGVLPAAALSIPTDDIAKYLTSPIVINEDDPEDVVEKKIATAEMKELLKDYIKEGGTWEEFVMELNEIRRNEHMLHSQAIAEIARMLREGDDEGAQLYSEKVDQFMKSKGYRGLKVPEKWGLFKPEDAQTVE